MNIEPSFSQTYSKPTSSRALISSGVFPALTVNLSMHASVAVSQQSHTLKSFLDVQVHAKNSRKGEGGEKVKMKSKISAVSIAALMMLAGLGILTVEAAPPGPTIVEVAIAVNSSGSYAGQFDTLIAAVLAADPAVIKTLSGNGQFTVFAPTDGAFAVLGLNPGNIGTALPQGDLTNILLYHVARGRRYAVSILSSERIRTLYGDFLMQDGGVLTDNLDGDANIIVPDVEAANGIIHAIDAVVLPYAP
jgi:uncharacterized surface protein with fasciclin (FAS1) repeats